MRAWLLEQACAFHGIRHMYRAWWLVGHVAFALGTKTAMWFWSLFPSERVIFASVLCFRVKDWVSSTLAGHSISLGIVSDDCEIATSRPVYWSLGCVSCREPAICYKAESLQSPLRRLGLYLCLCLCAVQIWIGLWLSGLQEQVQLIL